MIRGLNFLIFITATLFSLNSHAQDRFYHVYFDTDNNSTSGCDVPLPDFGESINGVEGRLTITTNSGQPPIISGTRFHECNSGVFDSGSVVSQAALGLNTGESNADVIEAQLIVSTLNLESLKPVTVYYATESTTASDILLTTNSGGPITLGFPTPVPSLGLLALGLLILGMILVLRKNISRKISVMMFLVAGTSIAWAMVIVVDGQTTDWGNRSPVSTDPINDTSAPGSYADIIQVFHTEQDGRVYFRIDVVDVENQAPLANSTADNTPEETPVTLTVTGSDAEGEPITFVVDTPPANGSLSGFTVINNTTSSIQYTPATDFNGDDTFTFAANDGQVTSAPATATVTVNPINDAPLFTSGGNVNQLKTAGPYSEIWATAISAGAANESAQDLTFTILSNDNNAIFNVQPSIDSSGVLSFTGVPDATGTATITVNLSDDGGVANGGEDTSTNVNFTITLQGVNDEPSFVSGADQSVIEDVGAQTIAGWATSISAGPADESGQVLTFTVTNNDDPALFSVAPQVNATTGDLTFTPADDANGVANFSLFLMDDGGTANGGDDTSPTASFNITITPVNDAPAFTAGPNQSVLEDSPAQVVNGWATNISAGPADESTQTTGFTVTNNNNALFSTQPAINAAGDLSFTPAAGQLGSADVDVFISDNGGLANGGVDTSAIQTFTISVTMLNDAPSFTVGSDQTANEDAGAVTTPNWATNVLAGPPDEAGQNLTFNITANDNAALFSAGPSVAADGTLTYTPAANANGTANLSIELMDDGGTADGGVDTSAPQNFSIIINPVNDVPSFTNGGDVTVDEDSGTTDTLWATVISAGPADENTQTLNFNVTNVTNSTLFSVAPTVDATTGFLSFTAAAGEFGSSTVTINLMDNGGTPNGGVDTSADITFDITVSEVNEAPVLGNFQIPNATEETLLAFTAIATDPNIPAQNLTFSLSGTVPAGASITAGGDFTWTPTEAQGTTGTFNFDVVVTDDGTNPANLTDTRNLNINVQKANVAPVLTTIGPQSIDELSLLSFMATATDSDDPAQILTFSLGGAVPAGATISAAGAFSWTPTEAQGPGVYSFDVIVTDDGVNPADLSATETISVTVNAVNTAPVLAAIGNLTTDEETLLTFNATATDSDLPAQALTFSLNGEPAGAAITAGGVFSWTPTEAQGPGMYTFDVVVTDNGTNPANLSDSESITVTVNEVNAAPTANAQSTTTDDATPIVITLTGSDPEGDALTFSIETAPSIGSLGAITQVTPTSANVTYTPTAVGTGDFTFRANDGSLDSLPATVTLPVTSSNTAPSGVNDSYNVTGNVGLDVPTANGVTSNDTDPEADTLIVTAFDVVSVEGGTVSVNANGSFTYDPPAGFTGADSFGYTLSDNEFTDTATVNLTVANKVWFIDNSAAAGDGRLISPFNSITAFNAGATDTAGDVIHIDLGNGSSTGYDAGITLLDSQRLIGQGVTLNSTNAGFTFSAFTRALPTAATNPTLVRTNANSITVGNNNTIRGLTVGNTGSGTGLTGNGFGTLTISAVTVLGTGKAVDLNNGTAAITFDVISSNNSATNGIDLSNISGSFIVNGGTISNSTQSSVLLTDVSNVALNNLTINNSQLHGIEGLRVTTLDLTGVTISGSGDALNENGIFITNLRGSGGNISNFQDINILNTDGDNAILILQTENATSGLLVDGDTLIEDAREGGIEVRTQNATATFDLIVGNTSALGVGDDVIIDNTLTGVLAFAELGTINATVRNTEIRNGTGTSSINRAGSGTNGVMFVGISAQSVNTPSRSTLNASGNDVTEEDGGSGGTGRAGVALGGSANVSGLINNNIIESDDEFVRGFISNFSGVGNLASNTISIDGNTMNMSGSGGNDTIVGVEYRASNSSGELSVTTTNNTIFSAGDNGFSGGIFALAGNTGTGHNNILCSDIIGNSATAPNAVGVDGEDYGLVSFTGTEFRLENPIVGALNEAQVDNHIINNDSGVSLATDVNVFNVGGAFNGVNSSCPQ